MKTHVILCGERGVGKTTLVERLLKETEVPVYGFSTKAAEADENGVRAVYMYPAAGPYDRRERDNRIGEAGGLIRSVNLDVFEKLGMKLLDAREDGIIVMDEIGIMETGSKLFCSRILELLDGDVPVLATVKARNDISFLNEVRACKKADVFYVDTENRDALFNTLMEYVKIWNRSA